MSQNLETSLSASDALAIAAIVLVGIFVFPIVAALALFALKASLVVLVAWALFGSRR